MINKIFIFLITSLFIFACSDVSTKDRKALKFNRSDAVLESLDSLTENDKILEKLNKIPRSYNIILNAGAEKVYSEDVQVNLFSEDASHMFLSNDIECSEGEWEEYSDNKSWKLSKVDSEVFVYVKFKNEFGESPCIGDSVVHRHPDTEVDVSFSINAGAETTFSRSVELYISADDMDQMFLSHKDDCSEGGWEPYLENKSWKFVTRNTSEKSVYIKFKNSKDPSKISRCIGASIYFDPETAPLDSFEIEGGLNRTSSQTVRLSLYSNHVVSMYISNDNCDSGEWEPYSEIKIWELAEKRNTRIYVKYKKDDDRITRCLSEQVLYDPLLGDNSSFLTINAGSETTENLEVTLSMHSPMAASTYLTNREDCTVPDDKEINWRTYEYNRPWTLRAPVNGTGLTKVYAKFIDKDGNVSSCIESEINVINPVSKISVGNDYVCAVMSNDKSAKCWGSNVSGKLGQDRDEVIVGDGVDDEDNHIDDMGSALPVTYLGGEVEDLTLGGQSSCAMIKDGDVIKSKCWGKNWFGELGQEFYWDTYVGLGKVVESSKYKLMSELGFIGFNWSYFLSALSSTSQIAGNFGQSICALREGVVYCWGYHRTGASYSDSISIGTDSGLSMNAINQTLFAENKEIKALDSGKQHHCALAVDGSIYCWGRNGEGMLGIGNKEWIGKDKSVLIDTPVFNASDDSSIATQVIAGGESSCAIFVDQSLKCWGRNNHGQLGIGDIGGNNLKIGDQAGEIAALVPIDLGKNKNGDNRKVTQASIGDFHICALTADGDVFCWGKNEFGQLGLGHANQIGDGSNEMGDNLQGVDLGENRKATQVEAGNGFTCALLDNKTVKCWGRNSNGQLGQGNKVQITDPKDILPVRL